MQALARYEWPGNVRQLRYALESAYVMSADSTIFPEHLGIGRRPVLDVAPTAAPDGVGQFPTLDELERVHMGCGLFGTGRGEQLVAMRP